MLKRICCISVLLKTAMNMRRYFTTETAVIISTYYEHILLIVANCMLALFVLMARYYHLNTYYDKHIVANTNILLLKTLYICVLYYVLSCLYCYFTYSYNYDANKHTRRYWSGFRYIITNNIHYITIMMNVYIIIIILLSVLTQYINSLVLPVLINNVMYFVFTIFGVSVSLACIWSFNKFNKEKIKSYIKNMDKLA